MVSVEDAPVAERTRPGPRRRSRIGRSLRRYWQLYLLLLIPVVWFIVFLLILNDQGSGNIAEQLERRELRDLLRYSTVVIATVPMMIVYPFAAKHFNKGVMVGAVKG